MKNKYDIILICMALLVLAGISNGIMDTLQFHYHASVFPQGEGDTLLGGSRQYFDPLISWRNKYKNGDPEQGPAYFGSMTVFVFLTDAWHLAQFFMLAFFQLAVALPLLRLFHLKWWWALPALIPAKFLFAIGFTIMYAYILKSKNQQNENI